LRSDDGRAIVVDPGPDDSQHLQAILSATQPQGVGLIVLTHGHADHAEAALSFAEMAKAPVRALALDLCKDAQPLQHLEILEVDGLRLQVIATPGHTADSACFIESDDRVLLTGDTILGRGSTVVAHPDGRLADYVDSLRLLRSLVDERQLLAVLPGHGPSRDDPAALIDEYVAHREQRLDQVRAALASGATTADEVVDVVYGDVDEGVKFAARCSVLAQLEYLGVTSPGG
jgi:glyoxylase-like metal-dependent hydrolase (beta-lactamase superfamily II)